MGVCQEAEEVEEADGEEADGEEEADDEEWAQRQAAMLLNSDLQLHAAVLHALAVCVRLTFLVWDGCTMLAALLCGGVPSAEMSRGG